MLYFPFHLINASTLPCKTENMENVSFHVHVDLQIGTQVTSELSPNHW